MSANRFEVIVNILNNICGKINKNQESNLEYVVLQGLSKDDVYLSDPFIMYKIEEFYNHNWLGNADFMHIPNFSQVEYNCKNFPIIIAREKDSKDIVGISTLKYDENNETFEDPYYPISDEKYFSITGILTKMNSPYKGIGKKIYEIALKAHYQFDKVFNDTSIMCVIDCRNDKSLNALNSAAEALNDEVDENIVAKLSGYYILTNHDNEMIEAPTMVLNVCKNDKKDNSRNILEFKKGKKEGLYKSLLKTLRNELTDVSEPVINIDEEAGLVHYYHVKNYNSLPKIISNGTERGNNRKVRESSNMVALCRVRTF